MSYSAEQILSAFADVPGKLRVEQLFDNSSGDICRAFHVLNGDKRRRVLVRITEEYSAEELQTEETFNRSIAVIERMLFDVREKAANQVKNFAREPNFVLTRNPE